VLFYYRVINKNPLRWFAFNTGKNKILNGDFSIWQRGTTATSTSGFLNVTYLADRWTTYYYGGGNTANYTYSRQNLPYGDIPGYGGQYFARHAFPAYSSTAYWEWIHKIEDVRTLAGQNNNLSFWARVPSGTPLTISWEIMQNFGTGGSESVYSYTGFSSTTLTSNWQRMSLPLSIATVAGKTIGAGSYLQIKAYFGPTGSSGSAFTLDVTGMQLEASSVATPFTTNTANPQAELAACQRYFQSISGQQSLAWAGAASTTSVNRYFFTMPGLRPINPAIALVGTPQLFDGVSQINITSINNIGTASGSGVHVNVNVASSLTQYRPYTVYCNGGEIQVSAEL
jgi:hypothetical protein